MALISKTLFLTLFFLLVLPQDSSAQNGHQSGFVVEKLGEDRYKFTLDIRQSNKINSFVINVDGFDMKGNKIKASSDLVEVSGHYYFPSYDFAPKYNILFKDNGASDENSTEGVFSFTIDCSKWINGRYIVKISATNRPSRGEYFSLKNLFVVDKDISSSLNNNKNIESFTIWKDKELNAYFPTLINLGNNRLMLKFSTRIYQSHIDTLGGKEYLISNNGGKSWQKTTLNRDSSFAKLTRFNRKVVVDIEGWNFSKETGELGALNKSSDVYGSKKVIISTYFSNNKLENKKIFTVPKDVRNLLRFDEIHNENGLRLISMYGKRKKNEGDSSQVYFLRSIDDGMNWEFIYLTPKSVQEVKSVSLSEPALLELKNGNILSMIRGNKGLYQSLSYDGGKTWTVPNYTGIQGYPASLIELKDGRVLCVYGYRKNPMGIKACISYDEGITWKVKEEINIRSDGVDFDGTNIGYPKATLLEDGRVFIVYYIRTNNCPPFIAGSFLKL